MVDSTDRLQFDKLELANFGYDESSSLEDIISHIRSLDSDIEGKRILEAVMSLNQTLGILENEETLISKEISFIDSVLQSSPMSVAIIDLLFNRKKILMEKLERIQHAKV